MRIVLKPHMYPIKNGFAACIPELRLTAHGYSPELARSNLERVILQFLKPFERQGNLGDEVKSLGVKIEEDGLGLTVVTAN